jgi:D-lactate dehydrogenase (cytochrome)
MEFYSQNALDLLRWRKCEEPQPMDMPTIPEKAGAALFIEMFFDPMDDAPELDVLKAVVESVGADLDRSWAGHEPKEIKQFRHFRHMLPETVSTIIASRKKQHPDLHRVSADLAVPDEHLRDMWQVLPVNTGQLFFAMAGLWSYRQQPSACQRIAPGYAGA